MSISRALPTALLVLASTFVSASAGSAQVVRGRIIDVETGEPIPGAALAGLDAAGLERGLVFSDESGAFLLAFIDAGEYRITAEQIGYQRVVSEPLIIAEGDIVELEVRLATRPIELAPIVVTHRARFGSGALRDFYRRMERMRNAGFGQFVTRAEIEDRNPAALTHILQNLHGIHTVPLPGSSAGAVTMRRGGSPCHPAFYVDGVRVNRALGGPAPVRVDDFVAPGDVEAIEVYRGFAEMPGDLHDPTGCGVVAVWTRRGTPESGASGWDRTLLAIGVSLLTAGMILLR